IPEFVGRLALSPAVGGGEMSRGSSWVFLGWLVLVGVPAASGDDLKPAPLAGAADAVERLAASCRDSVVVITAATPDGPGQGVGGGFVVSADGLIATNLHVIGEARPVQVRLADGRRCEVTGVHAFDRALDLAVIRVAAKDLKPLPLGDSARLKQGQVLVGFGNPHGLTHSVVAGVVSGTREVAGHS